MIGKLYTHNRVMEYATEFTTGSNNEMTITQVAKITEVVGCSKKSGRCGAGSGKGSEEVT